MKFMFDCDDTLYDLSWPFKMTCAKLLKLDDSYDLEKMYATYRECGDEIFDKVQQDLISIDESGIYRIQKMCQIYGIEVDHDTCVKFQDTYKSYQHEIFMDKKLHEFFSTTNAEIAILTNGQNEHQRMKLDVLGVFKYFKKDHVYTSGELGYAKPDKRSFLLALEKMNEDASDWYYVGDNYINDMEGAKAAGLKTIHFNRHHQKEGSAADYIVYNDKELVDLLLELS